MGRGPRINFSEPQHQRLVELYNDNTPLGAIANILKVPVRLVFTRLSKARKLGLVGRRKATAIMNPPDPKPWVRIDPLENRLRAELSEIHRKEFLEKKDPGGWSQYLEYQP